MRRFFTVALLLVATLSFSQKPCDFSSDVKDSIGTYKSTREYCIYEKVFGATASNMYFSLVKTDELPALNVSSIIKSNDFIKAFCFDNNSRIYFQLANGKVVTLMYAGNDNCGTVVRDQKGKNNRIQTGVFLFMKDLYEELKKSPVNMMRIRYSTETIDYIIKSSFVSETDGKTYVPETYFMDALHCIMD